MAFREADAITVRIALVDVTKRSGASFYDVIGWPVGKWGLWFVTRDREEPGRFAVTFGPLGYKAAVRATPKAAEAIVRLIERKTDRARWERLAKLSVPLTRPAVFEAFGRDEWLAAGKLVTNA